MLGVEVPLIRIKDDKASSFHPKDGPVEPASFYRNGKRAPT